MASGVSARDKRNFERTLKEARIGTLEAQYELALMYANGIGVAIDISKAIHWLQQAATKGLAGAQYLLATRYLSGIGVDRDETAALLWLGRAVMQGHTKATLRLGRFLETSHRDAAMACMRQAADAGLADAQFAWAKAVLSATPPRSEQLGPAREYLTAAAQQGLAAAQHALGDIYWRGLGVAPDVQQALDWYRRASAQGSLQALVALHRLEVAGQTRSGGRSSGRRKPGQERRQAMDRWIEAAESGDADTRYHLGLMYELGLGLASDPEQAQVWYRSAAQQGDARAQLALARLLEGMGAFEALDWYRKSAEQGEAQAQFMLGHALFSGPSKERDHFEGMTWYLRAASQGHAEALAAVGGLLSGDLSHVVRSCMERAAQLGVAQAQFQCGKYGLESGNDTSTQQALHWFDAAARQGHREAQCALGLMYLEGQGVARNPKLAVDWLCRAAEQGEPKAQWNLGSLFASGRAGLPRDVSKALEWCQRSAKQGFAAGQATLGGLYARMERWPEATACLLQAAAQNDPEALFNLAQLGLQGKLQEISEEHALTYLNRAADMGVVPAQARLGVAYATGAGVALDPIEAHKWFYLASKGGDQSAVANLARSETLIAESARREALRRAHTWRVSKKS